MASIYQRNRSPRWWVKFHGPFGQHMRVATEYRIDDPTSEAKATKRAENLDRLSRLYREHADMEALEELVREEVVGMGRYQAELTGQKPQPVSPPTILQALHNSHIFQRQQRRAAAGNKRAAADIRRQEKAIALFAEHAGSDQLSALTLAKVIDFIDYLRDEKQLAWDTRRHHLVALRRASAGAASMGRIDQLADKRLDSRNEGTGDPITGRPIYTTEQLQWLFHAAAGNPPLQLATGLMGFAGLRPSELSRLQACDWDPAQGILRVGVRARKNISSRRDLPLPPTLVKLLDDYTRGLAPETPLINQPLLPGRGHKKAIGIRPLTESDQSKWWRKQMAWLEESLKEKQQERKNGSAAMDPTDEQKFPIFPPVTLRKAWVTAAMWDLQLPERLIDLYIGHQSPDLSPVTTGHYLSRVTLRLKEVGDAFETLLQKPE